MRLVRVHTDFLNGLVFWRASRLLAGDEGYALKQRFFPERSQPEWRIQIREYDYTSPRGRQNPAARQQ